jgi:hypothetical protein
LDRQRGQQCGTGWGQKHGTGKYPKRKGEASILNSRIDWQNITKRNAKFYAKAFVFRARPLHKLFFTYF